MLFFAAMSALPTDVQTLQAMLLAAQAHAVRAQAEAADAKADAAAARAETSSLRALAEHLRLEIARLKRDKYGQTSERAARLEQLELELENIVASAAEDEAAAEAAARVAGRDPHDLAARLAKPARRPLPEHLPRVREVIVGPSACPCCGGTRLSKVGEAVTETLEVVPRRWYVRRIVREKLSCRDCEAMTEPPAPFHAIPRGRAGPSLLAMVLFEKYGCHQPLNRQSERYAREGVELDVSTLADWVGACTAALSPLAALIEAHVKAGARLHGDDTTIPVLAKGKTVTGRIWTYVRDDRPFGLGATGPPAVFYRYSPNRAAEHPERHLSGWTGVLQADAYAGYGRLYDTARPGGAITSALCWAHARRGFYELADLARTGKGPVSPIATEAVRRIDLIFDAERAVAGQSASARLAHRREHVAPLVDDLHTWMTETRPKLSRHAEPAKAIDYMLTRWDRFARFLEDGRICLTNNAAERALRGIALGRKSWLFAGSDRGGERAAMMLTLIGTAKLNEVDPQTWLADVLSRIADTPMSRLPELLPWTWTPAEG